MNGDLDIITPGILPGVLQAAELTLGEGGGSSE